MRRSPRRSLTSAISRSLSCVAGHERRAGEFRHCQSLRGPGGDVRALRLPAVSAYPEGIGRVPTVAVAQDGGGAIGAGKVAVGKLLPPNGAFDAGLRLDPFPDRTARLLPSLLVAPRTGLIPAGDDDLMLVSATRYPSNSGRTHDPG